MHILLVITDYGSFNNFLGELALFLRKQSHEVSVICSNSKTIAVEDKENYQAYGIRFYFVPLPRSYNFFRLFRISRMVHRLVQRIQPDLVHLHFTTAMSAALFTGKIKDVYSIGTVHGLGYPNLHHPLKRWVFRQTEHTIIRRLDEFWVLNQEDYQLLRPRYGEKIKLYQTAGLGCDIRRFKPFVDPRLRQSIRRRMDIPEDAVVYIFVGRFAVFKGFHLVARAFLALSKTDRPVHLLLVGGKDPVHPTGLTQEEEQVLYGHPTVHFIPFTHRVARYLGIADVMVFPSVKEGMPVSIMEALAMHVPVITSDTRGCNELIRDGVNGYLLSKKPTVQEVKQAMLNFYEQKKDKENFSIFDFSHSKRSISRMDYVQEQYQYYLNIVKKLKS